MLLLPKFKSKKVDMPSQKKILLIINPIAGGNDKTALKEAVLEYAATHNVAVAEYETTGNDDEKAIKKLCNEYMPQRILVAGGDGTVKMVGEAVEDLDVVIGVLPAGSANGLSVDLELPSDIDEVLEIAFNGRIMHMDMVSINGKKSIHLSDLGINAELVKNYENGTIRGKLGYALQAYTTLKELSDPFVVAITTEQEVVETQARMVVIANTQKYGTGVTINPVGIMDDGKFEIVILKSIDFSFIAKILTGNMPVENDENVHIISTDAATITTNVPVSFQIDGEYCGQEQNLDIKILHRQMKIAVK